MQHNLLPVAFSTRRRRCCKRHCNRIFIWHVVSCLLISPPLTHVCFQICLEMPCNGIAKKGTALFIRIWFFFSCGQFSIYCSLTCLLYIFACSLVYFDPAIFCVQICCETPGNGVASRGIAQFPIQHSPQQSLCWCYITHTGSRRRWGLHAYIYRTICIHVYI